MGQRQAHRERGTMGVERQEHRARFHHGVTTYGKLITLLSSAIASPNVLACDADAEQPLASGAD